MLHSHGVQNTYSVQFEQHHPLTECHPHNKNLYNNKNISFKNFYDYLHQPSISNKHRYHMGKVFVQKAQSSKQHTLNEDLLHKHFPYSNTQPNMFFYQSLNPLVLTCKKKKKCSSHNHVYTWQINFSSNQ